MGGLAAALTTGLQRAAAEPSMNRGQSDDGWRWRCSSHAITSSRPTGRACCHPPPVGETDARLEPAAVPSGRPGQARGSPIEMRGRPGAVLSSVALSGPASQRRGDIRPTAVLSGRPGQARDSPVQMPRSSPRPACRGCPGRARDSPVGMPRSAPGGGAVERRPERAAFRRRGDTRPETAASRDRRGCEDINRRFTLLRSTLLLVVHATVGIPTADWRRSMDAQGRMDHRAGTVEPDGERKVNRTTVRQARR
jgi:hypothetical protein